MAKIDGPSEPVYSTPGELELELEGHCLRAEASGSVWHACTTFHDHNLFCGKKFYLLLWMHGFIARGVSRHGVRFAG